MGEVKKHLYPLRFNPIPKEKVWGGHALVKKYNKPFEESPLIGESWEISGFEEDSSIIANGFLAKNNIYDIIETYMGDIVGDDHYKYFGNEFPLLIKLLDINDLLSIQVHPDDETAFDRHNSYGKSEAWYVLESSPEAKVYMGFNRDVSPEEFYRRCKEGSLEEVLNLYHPKKGDFFYIEAGIVHSAGDGLVIAEVQQLSDATYRIYDWGRENNPATAREMHLELAFDSINFNKYDESKYFISTADEGETTHSQTSSRLLADNVHFTINLLSLRDSMHIYTERYESFILYFCIEGEALINSNSQEREKENRSILKKGEWVLIPASYDDFLITPSSEGAKILEVYIRKTEEERDAYIIDSEEETLDYEECECGHNH